MKAKIINMQTVNRHALDDNEIVQFHALVAAQANGTVVTLNKDLAGDPNETEYQVTLPDGRVATLTGYFLQKAEETAVCCKCGERLPLRDAQGAQPEHDEVTLVQPENPALDDYYVCGMCWENEEDGQ